MNLEITKWKIGLLLWVSYVFHCFVYRFSLVPRTETPLWRTFSGVQSLHVLLDSTQYVGMVTSLWESNSTDISLVSFQSFKFLITCDSHYWLARAVLNVSWHLTLYYLLSSFILLENDEWWLFREHEIKKYWSELNVNFHIFCWNQIIHLRWYKTFKVWKRSGMSKEY